MLIANEQSVFTSDAREYDFYGDRSLTSTTAMQTHAPSANELISMFLYLRACQEITDRQPDLGGAIGTRLAEPPFVPFRITVNLVLTSA